MKRVLFLIPTLGHGGAERVLVNLVNNMNHARFEVTVQTLFDVGINRQHLSKNVRYIPGFKWYFKGNSHLIRAIPANGLYTHLVREEYDIIVSYLEGPTTRVVSGCSSRNIKKVCWIHSGFEKQSQAISGFNSIQEATKAYNSFDKIIAVSKGAKSHFLHQIQIATDVSVLYNTNDTDQIILQSQCPVENKWFDNSIPVVGSAGKLISVKRFDRLLKAHKRLLNEGYLHKVLILGTGEEQKNIERLIQKYAVEESFFLLGYQENPYRYISRCDLYVCSSQREGFSTAVTEALILGTPVVSTDCSGAKELLGEHNEYGLVVENSEEGIYQGMKKMLSDPALLAHYKEKAKERGSFFSREQTVTAVEEMLDRL